MTVAEQDRVEGSDELPAAGRVLLLVLSNGIERFTGMGQEVFVELGVACQRLDLNQPGVRSHFAIFPAARRLLRSGPKQATLVVSRVALVAVAWMFAYEPVGAGISVISHSSDVCSTRLKLHRRVELHLMRSPQIRVFAAVTVRHRHRLRTVW